MSSTLFARGVNGQVGVRRKAEKVQEQISALETKVADVDQLKRVTAQLVKDLQSVRTTVAGVAPQAGNDINALASEIAAIKAQQAALLDRFESYVPNAKYDILAKSLSDIQMRVAILEKAFTSTGPRE